MLAAGLPKITPWVQDGDMGDDTAGQDNGLLQNTGLFQTTVQQGSADQLIPPHPWRRFVALGDSFTEGLDDPEPGSPGGYRGWADRAAEELSVGVPDFAYANLAVRGQLLHEVIDTQVGPALALTPDLVSFQAGGNDLFHTGADPDKLAALLEGAVSRLRLQGVSVLIFVGPDSGRSTVMGQFRTKIAIFNENMRSIAEHHECLVADLWAMKELHDPRMWSQDRLHPSALGHHAVAAMVLETLGVPNSLKPLTPKPLPVTSWRKARVGDIAWARNYLMPYVLRGIRHESPTGGFGAKRPVPAPLQSVPLSSGGRLFGEPGPPDAGAAPKPEKEPE